MFDHCLYFNTTSFVRKLEREWADAFRQFGLTPPQAFLLRLILEKKAALQSEIASEMNVARPTATRGIDQLVMLGFVEKLPSDNDGREVIIAPTKKAEEIKSALNHAGSTATKKMKRLLGEELFSNVVETIKSASIKL